MFIHRQTGTRWGFQMWILINRIGGCGWIGFRGRAKLAECSPSFTSGSSVPRFLSFLVFFCQCFQSAQHGGQKCMGLGFQPLGDTIIEVVSRRVPVIIHSRQAYHCGILTRIALVVGSLVCPVPDLPSTPPQHYFVEGTNAECAAEAIGCGAERPESLFLAGGVAPCSSSKHRRLRLFGEDGNRIAGWQWHQGSTVQDCSSSLDSFPLVALDLGCGFGGLLKEVEKGEVWSLWNACSLCR